jgi:beta-phosphoglucomutase family hydrolase
MSEQQRAVIWDLDGTLIDSAAYHWEAWQTVMAAENFVISYEDYVADFGKRNDEILRGRLGAHLLDDKVARISLAKEESYRGLVRAQGLALLPGARHWLEQLKRDGYRQALATSAPRGNIDAVFSALSIAECFDAVISSEEVKAGKPAPDVFLAAAAKLNVAPENCLVVEDAPAGIEAARRAGMRALGVRTTHPTLAADWIAERLDQLPANFFQMAFENQNGPVAETEERARNKRK